MFVRCWTDLSLQERLHRMWARSLFFPRILSRDVWGLLSASLREWHVQADSTGVCWKENKGVRSFMWNHVQSWSTGADWSPVRAVAALCWSSAEQQHSAASSNTLLCLKCRPSWPEELCQGTADLAIYAHLHTYKSSSCPDGPYGVYMAVPAWALAGGPTLGTHPVRFLAWYS